MKPHKFDTLSFVSGLIFTGFGLLFLVPNSNNDLYEAVANIGTWGWPLILLGIGLAMIVPLLVSRGREDEADELEQTQAD